MRPLKFARPRTLSEEAEAAAALRWLEQQPVPAGSNAEFYMENVVPNFRSIISLASQYQNRGLSLMKLVVAGYAVSVACIGRYGEQPEKLADSWAWWVRQGMLGAMGKQQE